MTALSTKERADSKSDKNTAEIGASVDFRFLVLLDAAGLMETTEDAFSPSPREPERKKADLVAGRTSQGWGDATTSRHGQEELSRSGLSSTS